MIKIEPGYNVRCVLKNGIIVHGVVLSWDEEAVHIQSNIEECITIIHKPEEQILITKVEIKKQSQEKDLEVEDDIVDVEPSKDTESDISNYGYPGFFTNENIK